MLKLNITINGVELNAAQALTVHTAIQSFAMRLNEDKKSMKNEWEHSVEKLYFKNIKSINEIYV